MKTTLRVLAAAAALAMATPAFAQGGGMGGMQMSPEQRLARQKEMLFQGITLSAEQSAKADTLIMQGMRKQMEAMQAMRGGGGDMAGMREQMQKMNAERNDALKALLSTDADKAKFDENLKNMPQGRRGGV
jgi:Spy/CpxP family protein refolding chaperone